MGVSTPGGKLNLAPMRYALNDPIGSVRGCLSLELPGGVVVINLLLPLQYGLAGLIPAHCPKFVRPLR